MAKRDYLFGIAQAHYVNDLWQIEDIAKKYDISTASLRKWMKDGEWVKLREQTMKDAHSLLNQNKKIAHRLGEKILKLLDDNKEIPATTLNAYSRLSSSLTSIKQFEESEEKQDHSHDPKELSKKTLHALETTFK